MAKKIYIPEMDSLKKNIENLKSEKENTVTNKEIVVLEKKFCPIIQLTNSDEINLFLQNEFYQYKNLQQRTALELGRILERVFEKLKDFDGQTTYCKFLEIVGINRMTALRYRNRAKLYDSLNEDKRTMVLFMRDDFIAKLKALNDDEAIISFIHDGASMKDLQEWIEEDERKKLEEKKIKQDFEILPAISFAEYKQVIINNFDNLEHLEKEKQRQVEKHLKKIAKILKGE